MKKETTLSVLKEIRDLLKKQTPIPELLDEKADLIRLDMKSHMTPQYLVNELRSLCGVWVSDYIDLSNITSDRKGDYTVYFKNVQEADKENKNKSANQLKAEGHRGITLEERLLLEIEYFKKTGNHLDVSNITFCTGSRDAHGDVPSVNWHSGRSKVSVYWYDPGYALESLRSRSAVFLT